MIADQYDFELRLTRENRTVEQLKIYVRTVCKIITEAEDFVLEKYPEILLEGHPTACWHLPKEITFVTSQELHDMYPDMDVHGRERSCQQVRRNFHYWHGLANEGRAGATISPQSRLR